MSAFIAVVAGISLGVCQDAPPMFQGVFIALTNPPDTGMLGVGIGTTNPQALLHISDFLNGRQVKLRIENTGPYSGASLQFKTAAPTNDWTVGAFETGSGAADGLSISAAGKLYLKIKADTGNVGIGTATPSQKLEVNGGISAGSFTGDGGGLSNIPLSAIQGGGATKAQVLTWDGFAWNPADAPNLADRSISAANLQRHSVTQNKLAPRVVSPNAPVGGVGFSLSSGSFSTGAAGVDVPNLAVSLTTTGRPVWVGLAADGSTNLDSYLSVIRSTASATATVGLWRDGTLVSRQAISHTDAPATASTEVRWPVSSINHLDFPPPGSHTYKLSIVNPSSNARVERARLFAFEL